MVAVAVEHTGAAHIVADIEAARTAVDIAELRAAVLLRVAAVKPVVQIRQVVHLPEKENQIDVLFPRLLVVFAHLKCVAIVAARLQVKMDPATELCPCNCLGVAPNQLALEASGLNDSPVEVAEEYCQVGFVPVR